MYFINDWYSDLYILTNILDYLEFYSGTERRNMVKTPKGNGSMLYGYTWKSYLSPTRNRTQSKYEKLYHTKIKDQEPELEIILKEFSDLYFPNFNYTQIQLNKNFPAPPHIDSKNVGESILVVCGSNLEGGTTGIDFGNEIINIDASEEPLRFNGSKYTHWVNDWTGTRYSLVFFNNLKNPKLINNHSCN